MANLRILCVQKSGPVIRGLIQGKGVGFEIMSSRSFHSISKYYRHRSLDGVQWYNYRILPAAHHGTQAIQDKHKLISHGAHIQNNSSNRKTHASLVNNDILTNNYSNNSILSIDQYGQSSYLSVRNFHSGVRLYKEESKLEQTVKALKKEEEKEAAVSVETPKAPVAVVKPSLLTRISNEVKHYYHGFRLLFIDVRICLRYGWDLLNGKTLSRRERRQLVRTTADLFRLVPFSVFIIVPFMELLLPVAIKLFPNMLPSTFQTESKEAEKSKKRLKVKLEMAKFLQDTIEETALQVKGKKSGDQPSRAEEFSSFIQRIRSAGTEANVEEILKFSKLFEDEITLDNISRGMLIALCKVLDLPTIGTDAFLRFQLKMRLRQLKADDKMIMKEGIDSLHIWELQAACRARGMRAMGVPSERLKSQLEQWLVLHLDEQIPTSLLLLSRALYLPETLSTENQLKATISQLPESTTKEATIKVAELGGEKVDNKTKLELIKEEEARIKKEKEEEETEKLEKKAKVEAAAQKVAAEEAADAAKAAATATVDATATAAEQEAVAAVAAEMREAEQRAQREELRDVATSIEEKVEELIEEREDEVSSKDLEELEDAIESLAEEKNFDIEQNEIEELKEDMAEYKEDLEDLKEVIIASGGKVKLKESKSALRLKKQVNRMLEQMGQHVNDLQREKEEIMEDIEVSEVKIRRNRELMEDQDAREQVLEKISEKKLHVVSINELVLALKRIQKVPGDTRLEHIISVLDDNEDGCVELEHVLQVIELVGKENVKIAPARLKEVLELLKREDLIEEEEKLIEKQVKEQAKQGQEKEKSAE